MIQVPTSIGEYVDKLSILFVKLRNISFGSEKWQIVYKELGILSQLSGTTDFQSHLKDLIGVNTELWQTEDFLRELVKNEDSWDDADKKVFIDCCKRIRTLNDDRAAIKLDLNTLCKSEVFEVKQYAG